jgi:APA family basic amino acid/polyamine antiporter
MAKLARRLGVFDAGLIVMGGIIGSGIFRNPSVVAQSVHASWAVMAVWVAGGFVALLGAFVFAELAARRPHDGGLYAYMHDAFHPVAAFAYGWTLLIASQSGGMAASAILFAGYFQVLANYPLNPQLAAFVVLAIFTIVNCLGVRQGSNVQNAFMVLKIAAIALIIGIGFFTHPAASAAVAAPSAGSSMTLLGAMAVSMIAVLFAYSGWQTSSFMTGELKEPARMLPRGMLWGVCGVIVLYLLVNIVSLRVLGPYGLMHTNAPASDVLRAFMGAWGAKAIAAIIALSTLGFLSNQILTSPRVYHAMAEDGLFFKQIAWLHPKTRVPVVAIALQGAVAMLIALFNNYGQILNKVIGIDYVFFALSAVALFIFRARDARAGSKHPGFCVPLHPLTTALFLLIAVAVILTTYLSDYVGAAWSLGALASGVAIYYLFLARQARGLPEQASGNS